MNYQEALAYLDELNVFGSKLGLVRINRLLGLMGYPQERYHTIHVTGTNGKGSVSAMLAGILNRSDIHTGLYISPHLVSYTERIQVDGQPIGKQDFADCMRVVKTVAEQMVLDGEEQPTQFEILTAMAFLYFAKRGVEYAVIEVGLGGLLDSTNVIVPEISIITNVTLEHADRCGGTLDGVAHHKAGIIKEGVPVVTAAQGEPLAVIEATAEEKNADIFIAGRDFASKFISSNGRRQTLEFSSPLLGIAGDKYELQLLGHHQIENSSLAMMAAEILHQADSRITEATIHQALGLVEWPGRFERLDLDGQKIVVDGAHNPAGMVELRTSLDTYFPTEERVIMLGILKDKDIDSMLKILLRPNDTVIVTAPQSNRASDPEIVAKKIQAQHIEVYADNKEALARSIELADKKRLLCIAGSLYLIGGVRQMILQRRRQPAQEVTP
jgi:dihydrofolate synthase/folylpolyglutamate synthase